MWSKFELVEMPARFWVLMPKESTLTAAFPIRTSRLSRTLRSTADRRGRGT